MPEMSRRGMQSAFPYAPHPSEIPETDKRVSRQTSRRENSFVGGPGVTSSPVKETKKKDTNNNNNNRAKSSDSHDDNNSSKLFSWLNSGFSKQKDENIRSSQQLDQQWIMREKYDMKSMPPVHIVDEADKSRGQEQNCHKYYSNK